MLVTRMPIVQDIGTSLVGVGSFGLATALNYSQSGWVNWPLALLVIAGGGVGGRLGARVAKQLETPGALNAVFASMFALVTAYMLYCSIGPQESTHSERTRAASQNIRQLTLCTRRRHGEQFVSNRR